MFNVCGGASIVATENTRPWVKMYKCFTTKKHVGGTNGVTELIKDIYKLVKKI